MSEQLVVARLTPAPTDRKRNVVDFEWHLVSKASRRLGLEWENPGIEFSLRDNLAACKVVAGYPAPSEGIRHNVGIYFLWDKGQVSYIGQSQDIQRRICAHRKTGKVFDEVGTVGIKGHRLPTTLSVVEAVLIGMFQPRDNKCIPPNEDIKSKSSICNRLGIEPSEFDMRVAKGALPIAFEFNGVSYWYDYDFSESVCFLDLPGGAK